MAARLPRGFSSRRSLVLLALGILLARSPGPGEALLRDQASCDLPGGTSGSLKVVLAGSEPWLFYRDRAGTLRAGRLLPEGPIIGDPLPEAGSVGTFEPLWDGVARRLVLWVHDLGAGRLRVLDRREDGVWRRRTLFLETGRGSLGLSGAVSPGGILGFLGNSNALEGERYPLFHRASAPEGPWTETKLYLKGSSKQPSERGRQVALAFDEAGRAHGVFASGVLSPLYYGASRENLGLWDPFEPVDLDTAARFPSLIVETASGGHRVQVLYQDRNAGTLVRGTRTGGAWRIHRVDSCDVPAAPRLVSVPGGGVALYALRRGGGEEIRLASWRGAGRAVRVQALGRTLGSLGEGSLFLAVVPSGALLGGWCAGDRLHWFRERSFPLRRPEAGLGALTVPQGGWTDGTLTGVASGDLASRDLLEPRDLTALEVQALPEDPAGGTPGRFLAGVELLGRTSGAPGSVLPLELELRLPLDPRTTGLPEGNGDGELRRFFRQRLHLAEVRSGEPILLRSLLPDPGETTEERYFSLSRSASPDVLTVGLRVLVVDDAAPNPLQAAIHQGKGFFVLYDGVRDGDFRDPWVFYGVSESHPTPSSGPSPSPVPSRIPSGFPSPSPSPVPQPSGAPPESSPTSDPGPSASATQAPGGCSLGGPAGLLLLPLFRGRGRTGTKSGASGPRRNKEDRS